MVHKVKKSKTEDKPLTPIHKNVVEIFAELRNNPKLSKCMKKNLPLVNEFDSHGSKCVIIYIKAYILNAIQHNLKELKQEVEKKLGKQVYFIGHRRIIPKPSKRSAAAKVHRPQRRTVTAVHESILKDLIFPSEIMGKRTIYRPRTGKLLKIFLDQKDKPELQERLRSFSDIYKRLTRRDIKFEFPIHDCPMRLFESTQKKSKEKISA
ncbi:hypothetical protein HZS_147 [Henneguya salminicola]|nr:hypothetical protein HZS_147 [Henneguya salminicola]